MFFSIDVETSSTNPFKGTLLTVGIVPVTQEGEVLKDEYLYLRIDDGVPIEWDPQTLEWWNQQEQKVKDEAYLDRTLVRYPIYRAAGEISAYLKLIEEDYSKRFIAANPVAFDKPWLDKLYAEAGFETPYHYRSLCLRSMKYGMTSDPVFGSDRETHDPEIPHHAYYDALAQAYDLQDMMKKKEFIVFLDEIEG